MNSMVNFILESGISLTVFAVIYLLFLRKETFFRLNRIFLLSSVVFSVILPFLRFQIYNSDPVMLSEITVTPYRNLIEAVTVYGKDLSGSLEEAILSANSIILIYITGTVFFFARFLFRVSKIILLIKQNNVQKVEGFKLVVLEKDCSPFSFLNFVFVSRSLQKEDYYHKLIAHELEHVKQGHSFDVIILELLSVFQWFNPFMWMLRRAITENHEYLADHALLKSGIKKGYYKKLLLNHYVGEQFQIANNFNYSLIKNRIKMMSKIKSSRFANGKIVLGILAATVLVIVFACEQKESFEMNQNNDETTILQNEKLKIEGAVENMNNLKQLFIGNNEFDVSHDSLGNIILTKKEVDKRTDILEENDEVFFVVEEMPEFPGGEEALGKYITSAVEYPEEAVSNGIQGKVYVSFIVTRSGTIANAKIARGVAPSLDQEALRVINSLPKWKPGAQRGKAVNVSYTVPINFELGHKTPKQALNTNKYKS